MPQGLFCQEKKVLQFALCLVDCHSTRFNNQLSALSIQQAFSAIFRSVLGLSNYLQISAFSSIFAKPSLMADTLLILALPSFPSLWLFPMSMHSFSAHCRLGSWASQELVLPFTSRLFMIAPRASWMTYAMPVIWLHNAGHFILEALRVDCNLQVIEWFEETFAIAVYGEWPLVSSKRSRTAFKCMASRALW